MSAAVHLRSINRGARLRLVGPAKLCARALTLPIMSRESGRARARGGKHARAQPAGGVYARKPCMQVCEPLLNLVARHFSLVLDLSAAVAGPSGHFLVLSPVSFFCLYKRCFIYLFIYLSCYYCSQMKVSRPCIYFFLPCFNLPMLLTRIVRKLASVRIVRRVKLQESA